MEAAGREALRRLDQQALAARFGRRSVALIGGFENVVFDLGAGHVLRLTYVIHRSREAVAGELEWLFWLASLGVGVARPVSGIHQVDGFAAVVFDRAPGGTIEAHHWGAALFRRWGQLVGALHSASVGFVPRHPRWHWQDDPNYAFGKRIPASQAAAGAAAAAVLDDLAAMPQAAGAYGLVHGDAHPGNFHIAPGGGLMLFDFDDCHYGWLACDVASVLLSVTMQPWVVGSQRDREDEVRRFLPAFVAGYQECRSFAPLLAALPCCLKLRELSQYAIIVDQIDADTQASDPFVSRFMEGRRARIEERQPFLAIDFEALLRE